VSAGSLASVGGRVTLMCTFAVAGLRYWLTVFPRTRAELRHWRRRAADIPDAELRQLALEALDKSANIEGAAAFAAAIPGRRRRSVVRALVAFQATYNYVDLLAEQLTAQPVAAARRLHEALLVALDPRAAHRDYHAFLPAREDGGYLIELIDRCRGALEALPAYATAALPMRASAAGIAVFQSLILSGGDELEGWARARASTAPELYWWETAAAAGSSLVVHALIAAAAEPALTGETLAGIQAAYFPWAAALHSLLDSAEDEAEDAASGQLSLIGLYPSAPEAAMRMRQLARDALRSASAQRAGRRHAALVVAMACSYLSRPHGPSSTIAEIAPGLREELGVLAGPALLVFAARRRVAALARVVSVRRRRAAQRAGARSTAVAPATARAARPGDGNADADARAA